jgi:hypothetical protein
VKRVALANRATHAAGRRASGVVGATCGARVVDGTACGASRGTREGVEATWRGKQRKARHLGWRGSHIRLKEEVEIDGWGGASKWKHIFIEDDVTVDDDVVGSKVKTVIPLVVRGVAKEEAVGGARR